MRARWKALMSWHVPPMPLVQKVILFLLFLCVIAPLCQNTSHVKQQVQQGQAVQTVTEHTTLRRPLFQ
jgi:hypothetical protein